MQRLTFPFPFVLSQPHDWKVDKTQPWKGELYHGRLSLPLVHFLSRLPSAREGEKTQDSSSMIERSCVSRSLYRLARRRRWKGRKGEHHQAFVKKCKEAWRWREKTHASSPSTSGKTNEKLSVIQTRRHENTSRWRDRRLATAFHQGLDPCHESSLYSIFHLLLFEDGIERKEAQGSRDQSPASSVNSWLKARRG